MRCMPAALSPIQAQGVHLLPYLDDWLLCAPSREQAIEQTRLLISHLTQLGLKVNFSKSQLVPCQSVKVHRYTTGLEVDESLTVTSECGQHFAPPSTFPESCQASIQVRAQFDIAVSSGSAGDSTGSALASPLSEMGEQSAPELHMAQEKTSKNYRKMPSYLETVEEEIISDERSSAGGDSVSPRSSSNRCVTDWLGSSVATQSDQGKLEFRSSTKRHKYFGVESSAASSGALWTGVAESSCSYKDRQYFSGISHQSSGRHKVQSLDEVDMGHSDVGFPSIGKHQSNVCTRGFEHGGRFLVPSQTLARRVEAQSGGSSNDLASIWQSKRGSLRLEGVNTLPSVVLMDGTVQPVGSGCTSTHVARSTTLCLYSNSPNSAKSPQDTERTLQGALSGTKLARETMVPIVIQTSQGRTLESSQETGSSPAVAGTDLASKFRQTTALCLAAEEPELLFGACDMNVKNTILNSRAPSTRNMYACRWKLFTEWCTQRGVIPEQCPVPLVLCFLHSLLSITGHPPP